MSDTKGKSIFAIPVVRFTVIAALVGLTALNLFTRSQEVTSIDKMTSVTADATVTEVRGRHVSEDDGYETEYSYLVSYRDSDRISHEGVPSVGKSRDELRHAEADMVTVRYDPGNPDEGCLIVGDEDLVERESGRLVLGIVGIVACAGFAIFLKLSSRNKATADRQ